MRLYFYPLFAALFVVLALVVSIPAVSGELVELKLKGTATEETEAHLRGVLQGLEGVETAEVDFGTNRAEIVMKNGASNLSDEDLIKTIQSSGVQVESIRRSGKTAGPTEDADGDVYPPEE